MVINVNTGSIVNKCEPNLGLAVANSIGNLIERDDTTPTDTVIYPSNHRPLLIVEPETMAVVTGYNLVDGTHVSFRKVLRSKGVPIQGGSGCCPTLTVLNAVRLHSVELPCWKLNKCLPVFIIKTPGSYEIDVVGNNADVVVTAMMFSMQEVNDFSMCGCDCGVEKEVAPPPSSSEPAPEPEPTLHPFCDPLNDLYNEEKCAALTRVDESINDE